MNPGPNENITGAVLETEEASAQVYVSSRINNGLLQHSERPGDQLSYPVTQPVEVDSLNYGSINPEDQALFLQAETDDSSCTIILPVTWRNEGGVSDTESAFFSANVAVGGDCLNANPGQNLPLLSGAEVEDYFTSVQSSSVHDPPNPTANTAIDLPDCVDELDCETKNFSEDVLLGADYSPSSTEHETLKFDWPASTSFASNGSPCPDFSSNAKSGQHADAVGCCASVWQQSSDAAMVYQVTHNDDGAIDARTSNNILIPYRSNNEENISNDSAKKINNISPRQRAPNKIKDKNQLLEKP